MLYRLEFSPKYHNQSCTEHEMIASRSGARGVAHVFSRALALRKLITDLQSDATTLLSIIKMHEFGL
ncbi:hypothetical protein K439DRAFT_1130716 [Ramaria rubella]|nr:hypothetical protein K439DRAFT_1130716 [Ramaria rubella]